MEIFQELQELQNNNIDELKEKLHEINNKVAFDVYENDDPKTNRKINTSDDEGIEKTKVKKERRKKEKAAFQKAREK